MDVITHEIAKPPRGLNLARYAKALARSSGDLDGAASFAATEWRGAPVVAATLTAAFRLKAGIVAATTTGPTWSSPLNQHGISSDALAALRGLSIFDAVSDRMRAVPFLTNVPRQVGAGVGGAWIGEGHAVPVVSYAFDTVSLDVHKIGIVAVLTRELLRAGGVVADTTVRDALLGSFALFRDQQFLDPSVVATATSPASVTNGGTIISSSGLTAAQIQADLALLLAAITTSRRGLVWVMKPETFSRVSAAVGVPDLFQSLYGIPVVISANSPAQIALIDFSEVVYASGDLDLDPSTEATIQMDTAPTGDATVPTATQAVSLYQSNLTGFRLLQYLNWLRVRSGASATMAVTY